MYKKKPSKCVIFSKFWFWFAILDLYIIKAGIPGDQLEIALEPEAASIYCHLMHLDETQRDNTTNSFIREPGVKYMVVDIGGTCIYLFKQSDAPFGDSGGYEGTGASNVEKIH